MRCYRLRSRGGSFPDRVELADRNAVDSARYRGCTRLANIPPGRPDRENRDHSQREMIEQRFRSEIPLSRYATPPALRLMNTPFRVAWICQGRPSGPPRAEHGHVSRRRNREYGRAYHEERIRVARDVPIWPGHEAAWCRGHTVQVGRSARDACSTRSAKSGVRDLEVVVRQVCTALSSARASNAADYNPSAERGSERRCSADHLSTY
jgi:hypothetical protein